MFLFEKVAISPFVHRLQFIDGKIQSSEQRLSMLMYIDSKKDKIMDTFNKKEPYIRTDSTKESALAEVMKEIEEVTKNSGVILLNMKPDSTSEAIEDNCVMQKVNLSIEGAQRDIVKFFYKIDNNDLPLRLNRMDFKIKDRQKNLMEVDIELGFIYFMKNTEQTKQKGTIPDED